MTRGLLTIAVFVSVILFPWPLSSALAVVSAFFIPILPLAAGIFADTLYYAPHAGLSASSALPLGTISGAAMTCVALFVRRRLRTGII